MTGERSPKRKYSPEEEDAIIDKCLSTVDPHASKWEQEQAVKHCLIDEMLKRRRDSPEFMEVPSPITKPTAQGRGVAQYERETTDALRVVSQAVEGLSRSGASVEASEAVLRSTPSKAKDDEETAALCEVARALQELSNLEKRLPARDPSEISAEDLRKGLHCLEQAQNALSEASYLKFLDACTADLPPSTLTALGLTKEVAAELPIAKAAFKRAQRILVLAARQKFREYCFSVLSPTMRKPLGFTSHQQPSGVATGQAPEPATRPASVIEEPETVGIGTDADASPDGEKPYLLPHGRFENEEDVRYTIMNGFLKKGVDIWDCPAEFDRVKEPIIIDGIPFGILVGDFPFRWKGAYYIVEIKFLEVRCARVSESAYTPYGYTPPGKFSFRRIPKFILDGQSKMLREGGGFLIVVAEPSLETVGLGQLFTNTAEECQKQFLMLYKNRLAKNEIPYEVWVLNQKSFLQYL